MVICTNRQHRFTYKLVKKEESDIHKFQALKETGESIRKSHTKIKEFLGGTRSFKGHRELLDKLTTALKKEEAELKTLPDIALTDATGFRWREKRRVKRFEVLHTLCEDTQKLNIDFKTLLKAMEESGIFKEKEKEIQELDKTIDDLNQRMKFLVYFFQLYEKAKLPGEVVGFLEKLRLDFRLRKGEFNADYVNRHFTQMKKAFEKIVKDSEALHTYLPFHQPPNRTPF